MSVASSLSASRFTSGQVDAYLAPRLWQANRRVVIYCHGVGSNATEAVGATVPATRPFLASIVEAGHIVVCPTQTAQWGNATSIARMDDALAWARTNLAGSADPPVIVGISHGAACAFSYARQKTVACVVTVLPAIDLAWIRDNDPEGLELTAGIETALGLGAGDPIPRNSDPAQFAADLTAVPIQTWTCSDDDVSHNHAAFESTVAADTHNLGALGHTSAAVAAVNNATVTSFIAAH